MSGPREKLTLVVAMSENRVIGKEGALPWHIPEDLRHFRKLTTGHAVIMGRKTHDSIGRPLPNRRNIVVSRQEGLRVEGCEVVPSLDDAIDLARAGGDEEPMVIGGASIYEQALRRATHIRLTEIHRQVEGDAFFPLLDPKEWREVERAEGEDFSFVLLERRE